MAKWMWLQRVRSTGPKGRRYTVIIAVAVALILFIAGGLLFYGRDREMTVALSVRFKGIPPELLVMGNPPVMEARVRGTSRLLEGLKDSLPTHEIELALAKPGPLFVKISEETIKMPQGISVLEVNPASFTIGIEGRMEKWVPVIPDLNNDPMPGYVVSAVAASPSSIQLTGPASMLEKISAVRTTPVDLAGLTESAKKRVALNLNHNPHVQALGDRLVEVEIAVGEKIIDKQIKTQVQATGTHYRWEIRPGQVELLLRGPENTIEKLVQGQGMQVHVDLKGLKPGTYVRYAVIEPPLDMTLVEANPEVFTVKVYE
jgi:YbbR domain-containing protein